MVKPWLVKHRLDDDFFKRTCLTSSSMSQAAAALGLHFNTFKKRALELGCYRPNKAGIGIRINKPKIPLKEIIEDGLHSNYQSYKLKRRLILEKVKNSVCETCGISAWNDKELEMELHHIDGDRTNHLLSNLKMLCPNCHSQTENYRAKNRKI